MISSFKIALSLITFWIHHSSCNQLLDVSYGSSSYKYCECGRKNRDSFNSGRIVGGTETLANEYPWIAAIVVFEAAIAQLICGGSLINDRYVLSAAHCLRPKYTQDEMKVILGEHNLCESDSRTVVFSIEKSIQHPEYAATRHLFSDVMLFKLNMRVTFNAYIRPICLPPKTSRMSAVARYAGTNGDILGWGLGDVLNVSCALRKTNLVIYQPNDCSYKSFHLFCAGHLEGERDACAGDSGGPFQILNDEGKHVLIGIISSGIACGDKEAPGLYTDIAYVLSWIFNAAEDSMFCWR